MVHRHAGKTSRVLFALGTALALPVSAFAQSAQADGDSAAGPPAGDIIVTARKREESILKVPVVVTAISGETLTRMQTTEMTDLPRLVPGLNVGGGILSVGPLVSIRGVGTSSSDAGIQQSVSLNIDGLSLSQGLAFGSGMFDLQQIEVLKGPQALFYGKSSPGGVIGLRTADPTDRFEIIGRLGYEFEADEKRGELIVSGPLSNTLKGRLAGMYANGEGYFRNVAVATPGTGAANPSKREPQPESYQVRATLLWNPGPGFRARLKVNAVGDQAQHAEMLQLNGCPEGTATGIPQPFLAGDECRLNRTSRIVYLDPAAFPGVPNDGKLFLRNTQRYGTLELNYDLTPAISLTSTTGYYRLRSNSLTNITRSTSIGPTLAAWNQFKRRDLTEELRLSSEFSGPLNFLIGGYFQDSSVHLRGITQGNAALGFGGTRSDRVNTLDIRTYSLFGQVRWQIVPTLELAGGARWTDEAIRQDPRTLPSNQPATVRSRETRARNVAPEFTLTFTPNDDLTVFAAYKRAYKSGSFSIGTIPSSGINDFGDERVEGGEIGIKSRLAGGSLLFNVAAYDYRYKGLQVGTSQPSQNGLPVLTTVNAGSARTYGMDLEMSYRPAEVEGLSLNAAVNWNHGRYKVLNNLPCWVGQTRSLGCDQVRNPLNGLFTAQDISGTPLIRAPEWQATFGFDYEMPVGSGYKMAISNSNVYFSDFVANLAEGRPNRDNWQESFLKTDLSVALRAPDDRWEIALIGKNIGDKITASACVTTNLAGGSMFGQLTGGEAPGAAGYAESACYTERGRSVWLRLTLRPFNGR